MTSPHLVDFFSDKHQTVMFNQTPQKAKSRPISLSKSQEKIGEFKTKNKFRLELIMKVSCRHFWEYQFSMHFRSEYSQYAVIFVELSFPDWK